MSQLAASPAPSAVGAAPAPRQRSLVQKVADFITFPLRAFTLFHQSSFGLTSIADERYDFVASAARGWTLDVGCGRHNRFVSHFMRGHGRGIDLFEYEGLTAEHLVPDLKHLPFPDASFDTVTFIANLAHCPEPDRDQELAESFRVLRPGGRIVVTMATPIVSVAVHYVVWFYDTVLGTNVDVDTERGMVEGEAYYLSEREIRDRLRRAGFAAPHKQYFWTQWCVNRMFIATKPDATGLNKSA